MSIWYTRPPTNQDFPIWAYMGNREEVILIRSVDQYHGEDIVWCRANIPQPPRDQVFRKFQELADLEATVDWSDSDWFRAGYQYGKQSKDSGNVKKEQLLNEAQTPFVDPERYWVNADNDPF